VSVNEPNLLQTSVIALGANVKKSQQLNKLFCVTLKKLTKRHFGSI